LEKIKQEADTPDNKVQILPALVLEANFLLIFHG
jgi:hypothetical protein